MSSFARSSPSQKEIFILHNGPEFVEIYFGR